MKNALPFPVGSQSSSAQYAQIVGQTFQSGDVHYRLCKAGGTLTANWAVTTAFSAGAPTWTVNSTTTANDPAVAGFVTAAVTSGNYFLLQISGNATPLFATTTLVNSLIVVSIGTATTAGYVQAAGTTAAPLFEPAAICGFATNTAAVSAAGTASTAVIYGLIGKGRQ